MSIAIDINTVEWPEPTPIESHRVLAGNPIASTVSLRSDESGDVGVWRCSPGEFWAVRDGVTEFVHIISGRGKLVHDDGTTYELHPGVTFAIDNGWKGKWLIEEPLTKAYALIPVAK